mgnify:CR=1 FL=1
MQNGWVLKWCLRVCSKVILLPYLSGAYGFWIPTASFVCERPESNSILISIFELILILIMSFVFSRDDAVSNTVSRPVAGKLALAPHPVQNEGNCTWIRSVDVTCGYLRRLRSPWSPTGIAPWGTVTHRLRTSEAFEGWSSKRVTIKFLDHRWSPVSQRLRRIGGSWVVSRCLVFVSDSSFLSSLDISQSDYGRFVRILQVMSFSHSSRYEHKR